MILLRDIPCNECVIEYVMIPRARELTLGTDGQQERGALMAGIDYNDEIDDLDASIAKREARNPAYREMHEAAFDTLERAFLQQLAKEQASSEATARPSVAAGRTYRRDLTTIGMHAVDREPRERRYHRNSTQRKRSR